MNVKIDKVQNSVGEMCPMPIAHLAKNMRDMAKVQVLEVQADDEGAHSDIPAWCEHTNNKFLGEEASGEFTKYFVEKGA